MKLQMGLNQANDKSSTGSLRGRCRDLIRRPFEGRRGCCCCVEARGVLYVPICPCCVHANVWKQLRPSGKLVG